MNRLLVAVGLLGLASAGRAQTQAPPAAVPPPPGLVPGYSQGSSYSHLAANAGGIGFDQWAGKARERLMALDTDHDGRISKDEFAARGAMMGRRQGDDGAKKHDGSRMFARMDTNNDGYLDAAEINAMLASRFARMDANHDRVLTADERHAMRGPNTPEQ
jgi:Ca2+-binding EF-hand superfamily protein